MMEVGFPVPTWWPTITWNCSPRDMMPSVATTTYMEHRHMPEKQPYT